MSEQTMTPTAGVDEAVKKPKREPYAHRVIRLPMATDPRCVVFVSARWDDRHEYATPIVSFAYVGERAAAEWCPPHGPISICRAADATDDGAEPHHIYPFIHPNGLDWSQMAVDDNGLPSALIRGDTEHVFEVLRRWAMREEDQS